MRMCGGIIWAIILRFKGGGFYHRLFLTQL
jgi:hypothetical protein